MTDEQKQKLADEYARPITCDGSDVYSYSAMSNVRNIAYLAGLNRGLDESKAALELLSAANHYLSINYPEDEDGYSTFKERLRLALQHTSQKDD